MSFSPVNDRGMRASPRSGFHEDDLVSLITRWGILTRDQIVTSQLLPLPTTTTASTIRAFNRLGHRETTTSFAEGQLPPLSAVGVPWRSPRVPEQSGPRRPDAYRLRRFEGGRARSRQLDVLLTAHATTVLTANEVALVVEERLPDLIDVDRSASLVDLIRRHPTSAALPHGVLVTRDRRVICVEVDVENRLPARRILALRRELGVAENWQNWLGYVPAAPLTFLIVLAHPRRYPLWRNTLAILGTRSFENWLCTSWEELLSDTGPGVIRLNQHRQELRQALGTPEESRDNLHVPREVELLPAFTRTRGEQALAALTQLGAATDEQLAALVDWAPGMLSWWVSQQIRDGTLTRRRVLWRDPRQQRPARQRVMVTEPSARWGSALLAEALDGTLPTASTTLGSQVAHDLDTAAFIAEFLGEAQRTDQVVSAWFGPNSVRSDLLAIRRTAALRTPRQAVLPDAVIVCNGSTFFVEIDRGTEDHGAIARKLEGYARWMRQQRGDWQTYSVFSRNPRRFPTVLFITGERRMRSLLPVFRDGQNDVPWLVTSWPRIMEKGVLSSAWIRPAAGELTPMSS